MRSAQGQQWVVVRCGLGACGLVGGHTRAQGGQGGREQGVRGQEVHAGSLVRYCGWFAMSPSLGLVASVRFNCVYLLTYCPYL